MAETRGVPFPIPPMPESSYTRYGNHILFAPANGIVRGNLLVTLDGKRRGITPESPGKAPVLPISLPLR